MDTICHDRVPGKDNTLVIRHLQPRDLPGTSVIRHHVLCHGLFAFFPTKLDLVLVTILLAEDVNQQATTEAWL